MDEEELINLRIIDGDHTSLEFDEDDVTQEGDIFPEFDQDLEEEDTADY
jgi:hypothetical protein